MDTGKAELLEAALTFDTSDYPKWQGDVGKCWVSCEDETITVVGWRTDMGTAINSYRLVVQSKERKSKLGVKKWIELIGWDDSGKEIKKKVFGTSVNDAVDVMLQMTANGVTEVKGLAAAVANLCTVARAEPSFGLPDVNGEYEKYPEPKVRTPPAGRPVTVGGKRVQVYLDDESIETANKLGNGNASEGIRFALKDVGKRPSLNGE